MKRSMLMVCAVFLMAGCYAASAEGQVEYRINGTSHTVKLISMWIGNKESQCVGLYPKLPWVYRFDGVPELLLGFSASKSALGSMVLTIYVNGKRLAIDSVPYADAGTAEVSAQWP